MKRPADLHTKASQLSGAMRLIIGRQTPQNSSVPPQNQREWVNLVQLGHLWTSCKHIWQNTSLTHESSMKQCVICKILGIQKSHTYFGMQLGTTQATAVQRKGQEINITPLWLAGLAPAVFQLPEFLPSTLETCRHWCQIHTTNTVDLNNWTSAAHKYTLRKKKKNYVGDRFSINHSYVMQKWWWKKSRQ